MFRVIREEHVKKQCPKSEAETNVTCPITLATYKSKIKLFPCTCKLRGTQPSTATISKYHILESKSTGRDICRNIFYINIGLDECYRNINLNSVVPALSPILELIKIRHNKFNYLDQLKNITENDQRNANYMQKYKNENYVYLV